MVENDTIDFYRYFDATAFAEYLYDRVAESVSHDLEREIGFLENFDRAFASVQEIVNMPDRRISLFIRLCRQNGGRLGKRKRAKFPELEDVEVSAMEAAVRTAMEGRHSRQIDVRNKRISAKSSGSRLV